MQPQYSTVYLLRGQRKQLEPSVDSLRQYFFLDKFDILAQEGAASTWSSLEVKVGPFCVHGSRLDFQ